MGHIVSLDDDIRNVKLKSRLLINGIADAVNKEIYEHIKSKYGIELELANQRTEIGNVESTMVGSKEYKDEKELQKSSDDIKDYISTIDEVIATEMVKKYGDL